MQQKYNQEFSKDKLHCIQKWIETNIELNSIIYPVNPLIAVVILSIISELLEKFLFTPKCFNSNSMSLFFVLGVLLAIIILFFVNKEKRQWAGLKKCIDYCIYTMDFYESEKS